MIKIATVGDNCMDVYDSEKMVFPGGNPVNVAVYLTRLGMSASYTGVVGNDDYGRIMRESLTAKGVDISYVREVPGSTAVTHVELKDGDRVFGEYEDGVMTDFALDDDDITFLDSHDIVVTGIWGMVHGDLPRIRQNGTPIVFDFATKLDDPVVVDAIEHVDYAFFSYDNGEDDFIRDFMTAIEKRGPTAVIVTLGESGSVLWDGQAFSRFGIVPCNVVDTMGAGDSYIAGFVKGVLEKRSLEECMRIGAESSSVTIGYRGAW